MHCLKGKDSHIYWISRTTDGCASVTAVVAKVEEVAPRGRGSIHEELEEIVKPDEIVEEAGED